MKRNLPATRNLAGILCALAIVVVLCVIPVSADVTFPTLTNVFFERNGTPVNESVSFTMNCYGTACYPSQDCWEQPVPNRTPQNESVVFSFSATCPTYGCKIYEPYYLNYRHIDRCDIEGDQSGEKFLIHNFSSTPDPNCTSVRDVGMYDGKDYVRVTPEYRNCSDRMGDGMENCTQYLEPVPKEKEAYFLQSHFPTMRIDGVLYNETPEFNQCVSRNDKKRAVKMEECSRYLEKINRSDMILDPNGHPVMRVCELRVPLSSPIAPGNESISGSPDTTSFSHGIFSFLNRIFGGTR